MSDSSPSEAHAGAILADPDTLPRWRDGATQTGLPTRRLHEHGAPPTVNNRLTAPAGVNSRACSQGDGAAPRVHAFFRKMDLTGLGDPPYNTCLTRGPRGRGAGGDFLFFDIVE